MKEWIKPICTGLLGGLLGGLIFTEVYLKFHINWTAFACFISVGAVIITTLENRKRFKQDWKQKQKTTNADSLVSLVSQFISFYQRCQTISIDILERESGFGRLTYDNEQNMKEMLKQRNEIIFTLDSIISQIKIIKTTITKSDVSESLFEKIDNIKKEINEFYRDNNKREMFQSYLSLHPETDIIKQLHFVNVVHKKISQNSEKQDKVVSENIEYLQEKTSQLYKELTRIN